MNQPAANPRTPSTQVIARRVLLGRQLPWTPPARSPRTWLLLAMALVLLGVAVSGTAKAWGVEGHRIVADIAQSNLTPAATQAVAALLQAEPEPTLAGVSSWADQVRTPATAPFHFVNFPAGECHFVAPRDCPEGRCLPLAYTYYRTVLAEPSATLAARSEALKWVVHLVGDASQPLHESAGNDRGGNQYQLQWRGQGTNLHKLWDGLLLQAIDPDAEHMAASLAPASAAIAPVGTNPIEWVEQGCTLAAAQGFYPSRTPGEEYLTLWRATLENQLVLGGNRLARVLNDIWP